MGPLQRPLEKEPAVPPFRPDQAHGGTANRSHSAHGTLPLCDEARVQAVGQLVFAARGCAANDDVDVVVDVDVGVDVGFIGIWCS